MDYWKIHKRLGDNTMKYEELKQLAEDKLAKKGFRLVSEYKTLRDSHKISCIKHPKFITERIIKSLTENSNKTCSYCKAEFFIGILKERLNIINFDMSNIEAVKLSILCPECDTEYIKEINVIKETKIKHYKKLQCKCPKCMEIKQQIRDTKVLRGKNISTKEFLDCKERNIIIPSVPNFIPLKNKKRMIYELYATRESYTEKVRNFDKYVSRRYNLPGKEGYELDHKFTISDAYYYGIAPWIVCYPGNREYLLKYENRSKYKESSISIEELLIGFSNWLQENPNYIKDILHYLPEEG